MGVLELGMYLALPPMSIMTWNTEGACLKIVHERGAGCPTPSSGRYTFFFSLMLATSWVFGAVRQKQSAHFAHRLLNTRARNSKSGQRLGLGVRGSECHKATRD